MPSPDAFSTCSRPSTFILTVACGTAMLDEVTFRYSNSYFSGRRAVSSVTIAIRSSS